MLNFDPDRTDYRALQTNQLATQRHVNDDHYIRGFGPGDFVIAGPGVPTHAQIPAATPRWPAVIMPAGGNSLAIVDWRKPSEWRSGQLRVRYWYTSPVGSVNTFTIQVNVDAGRTGEVLPATNLVAVSVAVAGPAVANTKIRSAYAYTTTSFGADDELFSLRITRIVPDANANEFHLMYAEVEHIPAQQAVS